MDRQRLLTLLFAGLLASPLAGAGTIAQTPLFLESSVEPNIMLLLDSSGSMRTIVPDAPYDPMTTYSCPVGQVLAPVSSSQVDLVFDADKPYFNYDGSSYDWGRNGSGNKGVTNKDAQCFDPVLSYNASLNTAHTSSIPYTGNYLNWYFGTSNDGVTYNSVSTVWGSGLDRKPGAQRRIDVAQIAATSLVNSLDNMRLGLAKYNAGDGASIEVGIASLDSTQKSALTTAISNISASGSTPLAEALHQVGRYFVGEDGTSTGHQTSLSCAVNGQYDGSLTLHPGGTPSTLDDDSLFNDSPVYAAGVSQESPICYHCQKNFVVLLTDGQPNGDQDITVTALQDYDGDCVGASPACGSFDKKSGQSYLSGGSDYLDDVALALREIDLRPDIDSPAGEVTNNVLTYTIGFADQQVINDPLMQDTATNGGGQFLTAANAASLTQAFNDAFAGIIGQLSSATAVATSSTELQTDTLVFQALFNSSDWSGQLLARPVASSGVVGASVWNGSASSSIPSSASRTVLSWDPITSAGFSFDTTNLSTINAVMASAAAASVTADQVNYLRGDQSNEQPGGALRSRSSLLGDIINSDPLFVTRINFGYSRLPGTEGLRYSQFRDGSSYKSRSDMIYVGANDGMLHGFAVSYDPQTNTATGVEKLAYVPTAVYSNLASLTSPSYSHRYFVDGSPTTNDAYIDPALNGGSSKSWRSILVGTTGAGGSGVFALDITSPSTFSAANVLWDVSASTSGFIDLGATIGQPSIARMADGNFYVVFGNGYNSSSGKAVLYLVQLDNPSHVVSLDTGTAGNGMSSPLVVDSDGDRIADVIYAGDLQGNLWKVNVDSATSANWAYVDHDTTSLTSVDPLFTAVSASGGQQSITARPEATKNASGEVVVLFGTGKFFEVGDNTLAATPLQQSFYGIIDNGSAVQLQRSSLLAQTILAESSAFGFNVRISSNTTLNPLSHRGWYMDLVSPVNGAEGERVIEQAMIRGDRVVFSTLAPDSTPCGSGGTSWLMELSAATGARLDITPFDLNDDGLYNDTDKVTYNGQPVPVSGIQDTSLGVIGGVSVLERGSDEQKVLSGSSGVVVNVGESSSGPSGRQSWQQLQ